MRKAAWTLVLGIWLAASCAVPALAAGDLLTGKANFAVTLGKHDPKVVGAGGRRLITLDLRCDRYYIIDKMQLSINTTDGHNALVNFDESDNEDAAVFIFSNGVRIHGNDVGGASGHAIRKDGRLAVKLVYPNEESFDLPGETLFPFAAISAIIDAALKGEKTASVNEFTGRFNAAFRVDAEIGDVRTDDRGDEETLLAMKSGLSGVRRWPMKLTTTDPASGEKVDEANIVLYENGFVLGATTNYAGMELHLRLMDFTPAPREPCP